MDYFSSYLPLILSSSWALWLAILAAIWIQKWQIRKTWLWEIGWILWWVTFAYTATRNWHETQEIWTAGWFLDESYHVIFGIVAALHRIYHYKQRLNNRNSPISGIRRFWFTSKTVILVLILGGLWEWFEYSWDEEWQPTFFPFLGRMQKGQADTMIDLALNPLGALAGIWGFCKLERKIYAWLQEQDFEEAELHEVLDDIQKHISDVERLSRLINSKKKEFAKERIRHLLTRFKKISEDEPDKK